VHVFETLLALLLGATILSGVARRFGVPYPTLLALGGAAIALIPGAPHLNLPPDLILALFVAPLLIDAAYDASWRDLKRNWKPLLSLVFGAVSLTTIAVAFTAHTLFPDMPWAAAVALGALVAPPDAVAALAVLRAVDPPHRIRTILEGESLLNDATALLIYRLAVGAVAAGGFHIGTAIPTFGLVMIGSVVVGWLAAHANAVITRRISDPSSSVTFQFVTCFALWLLAERLGLSGVVTVVVCGLTIARGNIAPMPARIRIPSFAVWTTATMLLNVLAFTLIGLQLRPILEGLDPQMRLRYFVGALAVLGVAIAVRLVWTTAHHIVGGLLNRLMGNKAEPAPLRGVLAVGWSGMRGIVTLAAAMALPADFPYRDFIQVTAFVVVVGTLVLQGLTLQPLLRLLKLPKDDIEERETAQAREAAFTAARAGLEGDDSPAAQRLRRDYGEIIDRAAGRLDPRDTETNHLRREALGRARAAIIDLRSAGTIGDGAYRQVEEELDQLELTTATGDYDG
jgi:CPA1 family monovalent cation:H+ antiporter